MSKSYAQKKTAFQRGIWLQEETISSLNIVAVLVIASLAVLKTMRWNTSMCGSVLTSQRGPFSVLFPPKQLVFVPAVRVPGAVPFLRAGSF